MIQVLRHVTRYECGLSGVDETVAESGCGVELHIGRAPVFWRSVLAEYSPHWQFCTWNVEPKLEARLGGKALACCSNRSRGQFHGCGPLIICDTDSAFPVGIALTVFSVPSPSTVVRDCAGREHCRAITNGVFQGYDHSCPLLCTITQPTNPKLL